MVIRVGQDRASPDVRFHGCGGSSRHHDPAFFCYRVIGRFCYCGHSSTVPCRPAVSNYSGPGEDERLWQTHELEGKYGITERFEVILEGEFEHPIDENFEVFSGRVMVSGLPSAPFMNLGFRAVRLTRSCSAQ
jgi:hypothetical protein